MHLRSSKLKKDHTSIFNLMLKLFLISLIITTTQNLSFAQTGSVKNHIYSKQSFVNSGQEDNESKGTIIISFGYGKLHISQFILTNEELGFSWNMYDIEFGYGANSIGTQILLDILFSEKRGYKDLGPAELVGGGYTEAYVFNQHWGGFIGVRQPVYWRFYLSAGIGIMSQERSFTYSIVVSNSGGTHSVVNTMWYWGVNIRVLDRILVGIKRYDTIATWESYDLEMNSLVYQVSYMF